MTDATMELVWKNAVAQVPAVTMIVVTVWLFLKNASEARSEFIDAIKRMHSENMEARALSRETIKANSEAAKAHAQAISNLNHEVKFLADVMSRFNK